MRDVALSAIELFSGVGMLGEGLRAGLAHMGVSYRTVCHVEREAYAGAVLAARMEEGSLDAAPVWSDVCTFDARAWCGRVDCVVAGFPCQDISVAGRREGLDGQRSGLFFEVTRIATDSGAWLLALENVAGIATATASVVDPEEGELDERAAARVVGELADLGWDAEWITLSASDVGASHGRARWFCLAWRRLGDTASVDGRQRQRQRIRAAAGTGAQPGTQESEQAVADSGGHGLQRGAECDLGSLGPGQQAPRGHDTERCDQVVADAFAARRRSAPRCDEPGQRRMEEQGQPRRSECGGDALGRSEIVGSCVADTSGSRSSIRTGGGQDLDALQSTERPEPAGVHRALDIFAPGPGDPAWAGILAEHPELAPALEPSFRGVVDGLAFDMGDSRAARLKCVGNGVVPLQAGLAFVMLARRAGLFS